MLGGYAILYPKARVITLIFIIIFFTIVELPLVVLGLWFLIQLAYGAAELVQPMGGSGGVAYFAHRRVRVRPASDQAVRQQGARGLRGRAPDSPVY